ncbi:MAG: FAD:protein FMN transferase [Opitutaceae bacterium]|nr:FAD:protein FMN transferase [Opitutaceae bacterium]
MTLVREDVDRRVLVPPNLPATLPTRGTVGARGIWDFSGATMGTHWRARVVECDALDPHEAEALIHDALASVVRCMSPWEIDSDPGRYRNAGANTWVRVCGHTFTVLQRALEVAALTHGAYDPTIGRLTDALGFGPSDPANAVQPESGAAELARSFTGYLRVRLDPASLAVFQPGGFELDLCSIAKGYAVDLAIDRLTAAGADNSFIEIGGEARGVGCKPDGQPWWCRIEPPAHAGAGYPVTVAAACGLALATSGNALRNRPIPSGELGHIVNPLPGRVLPAGLDSVTVLAPSCMEADAFATALYLLGPGEGIRLADSLDLAALFVERQEEGRFRERWSRRFSDFLA